MGRHNRGPDFGGGGKAIAEVEPVRETVLGPSGERDRVRETHPAYGMLSLARVSGYSLLYGSSFPVGHYVRMRVSTSYVDREMGNWWARAERRICEVDMAADQLANLTTTMNVGEGVQCTIRSVLGEDYPRIASHRQERHVAGEEFRRELGKVADKVRAMRAPLEEVARKLPKKDQPAVTAAHDALLRFLDDAAGFLVDQHLEATEKQVARARTEVASHISLVHHQFGSQGVADAVGQFFANALIGGSGAAGDGAVDGAGESAPRSLPPAADSSTPPPTPP